MLKKQDTAIVDRIYLQNYCDSKLANAMHSKKLSQVLAGTGVTTYSLHPGAVATEIWRKIPQFLQPVLKWFMLTEEQGAMTQLNCATEPRLGKETGLYYTDCQVAKYNPLLDDQVALDDLWDRSKVYVKEYFNL